MVRICQLLCILTSFFCVLARGAEPNVYFAYRSFWPEHDTMKRFASVGVHTYCVFPSNTCNSLGEPYSKYPVVWRYPEVYDWDALDRQFDEIVAFDPDAEFICMVDLNSPTWLARSLGMRGDGSFDSFIDLSNCLSSAAWREAAHKYLDDFLTHMEGRYGARVRAYVLACGQTDEWMDYCGERTSRAKNSAFVAWQKDKGLTPEPWPRTVAFDVASFENLVRDPASERAVLAAQRFEQELIADGIIEFAKSTREHIGEDKEIGVFFGYILELTDWRAVGCGHLDYERVMASEYVDFFISPGTYSERPMGGGSGSMAPNGTILNYGKRRLHETDHRTTTYNCALNEFVGIAPIARWGSEDEDVAGLRRELCLALTDRASIWFFDMWGGSFQSARAIENVGVMKRVWDKCQGAQGASAAEILLVVDPQSAERVNGREARSSLIYHRTRNLLNHTGAPFAVCSLNDLATFDLSRVKFAILPGSFYLTEERCKLLRERLLRDDRVALWLGPAGIDDGERLDLDRVAAITGAPYNDTKGAVVERVGLLGVGDGAWRSAALTDYNALDSAKLRELARVAGVNLYVEGDEPVYATERLLAIHAKSGGVKEIRLPRRAKRVTELFSEREVARDVDVFRYEFQTPETALFEIQY